MQVEIMTATSLLRTVMQKKGEETTKQHREKQEQKISEIENSFESRRPLMKFYCFDGENL